ncbi:MAG: hypothetical protein JXR78_12010 [Victivallales bacterium]|nr:hypothetical protein [Victivallales bacterium]
MKNDDLDITKTLKGAGISGKWNTVAGILSISGNITRQDSSCIDFELTASSKTPVEYESCYLELSLPCKNYNGKSVFIDGQEIVLPEKFVKRRLYDTDSAEEISIPTRSGRITIKGDLHFYLLDQRESKNTFTLRLEMSKKQFGEGSQSGLKLLLSIDDSGFYPVDLSKNVNMGFKDDQANDKTGGWTDQGENDLSSFKPGIRYFEGVKYNIIDPTENHGRSCLIFANAARPYFLKDIKIPVDHIRGDYIYVLHALAWASGRKNQVGSIIIHYADNTTEKISIMETKDASDWWKPYGCDNASLCWTGKNKFSDIGLYQSRFRIQNKPITDITLQTSQNSVWAVVGLTIGEKVDIGTFDHHDFRILKSRHWQPVYLSNNIQPGSIMDLSRIHPTREANRRITIKDGHFVYQDNNERVRFFGCNLVGSACFLSKSVAENLAEQLWKTGYNSVRLHHFDGYLVDYRKDHNVFNDNQVDKINYLISCLKKRGIYVMIDLFSIRRLAGSVKGKLGLKAFPSNQQYKTMMTLCPEVFEDWKNFVALLLNNVNPYTGLAWKDDPAIYAICLTNENCIGAYINNMEHPLINEIFTKDFNNWNENHKTENGKYNKYTDKLQRGIFNKTKDFVRSQGCNALLTDLNHRAYLPLFFSRQLFDFVDIHCYWDHPFYPVNKYTFPQMYKNNSSLKEYAEWPVNITTARLFGKPFTVSEYNYSASNIYRCEMGLLMGAYASLQDWDALYSFQFSQTAEQIISPDKITKFNICSDPVRLLAERIIAFLFLRGDAAPATNGIAFLATRECLEVENAFADSNKFMDKRLNKLGLLTRMGTVIADRNPIALPEHITHCIGIPEKCPVSLPPSVTYIPLDKAIDKGVPRLTGDEKSTDIDTYCSETGEIKLNVKIPSFSFVSTRSEGFILPEGASKTGHAVSIKNQLGYASVFVASYNKQQIKESRRLIVFHLTDVQNTKATFDSEEMKVWLKSGGAPLLVRHGIADISIKTQMADAARVWAVDMEGRRIKEMPVLRTENSISFSANTIQDEGTFLAYEIAEK